MHVSKIMRASIAASALTASIACAGCIVQNDTAPPPPPSGTLQLDWTINHTADPNQCAQGSAVTAHVIVYDMSGAGVGSYDAPCDSFSMSISLAAQGYTATVQLEDSAGNPRTTVVDVDAFTIRGGTSLDVPVDFSASSFY